MSVASKLQPVYYTSGVSGDWQGAAVYCLEYVPSFQLTPQDLPCSPELSGCRNIFGSLSDLSRTAVGRASPWYMLHLIVTCAMGLKLASRFVFRSPMEFCMKAVRLLLILYSSGTLGFRYEAGVMRFGWSQFCIYCVSHCLSTDIVCTYSFTVPVQFRWNMLAGRHEAALIWIFPVSLFPGRTTSRFCASMALLTDCTWRLMSATHQGQANQQRMLTTPF